MENRVLRSFVAVAMHRNFSAAARELNTVQPAVSRHISELEEELGVKLFWRNTRDVVITAAGQCLLEEARAILANEIDVKERVRRADKGEIGSLRIGYMPAACFSFLPQLVRAYAVKFPKVHIRLLEMNASKQIEAFASDAIDVGFSRPLPKAVSRGMAAAEIYADTLVAALPSGHPLAAAKDLRLRDLESESFVLFQRAGAVGLFDQIISICVKDKFTPLITSQPADMQTVLTTVASGLGISVVPSCVRHLHAEGCAFVKIRNVTPKIPLELQYRAAPIRPIDEAFAKVALSMKGKIQQRAAL